MTRPEQVLIGQLTDTHVLAADDTDTEKFVDNNARLADAVESINREAPALEAVVLTGDLTNDGRTGEYDELERLVGALRPRALPLAGNHDDPGELRRRFPDAPWAATDHASWVTTVGTVRLVGLDSTRPGQHGGFIDRDRAEWLGGVLGAEHDGPTLLAMHHPPFLSGIHWMDEGGIDGIELLSDVLRRHPVERVICGHLHRSVVSTIEGIVCQVGLSTVQHVHLDLGDQPQVAVVDDPIGYQIHRVVGRDVATHARFIRAGAPLVPEWADEYD